METLGSFLSGAELGDAAPMKAGLGDTAPKKAGLGEAPNTARGSSCRKGTNLMRLPIVPSQGLIGPMLGTSSDIVAGVLRGFWAGPMQVGKTEIKREHQYESILNSWATCQPKEKHSDLSQGNPPQKPPPTPEPSAFSYLSFPFCPSCPFCSSSPVCPFYPFSPLYVASPPSLACHAYPEPEQWLGYAWVGEESGNHLKFQADFDGRKCFWVPPCTIRLLGQDISSWSFNHSEPLPSSFFQVLAALQVIHVDLQATKEQGSGTPQTDPKPKVPPGKASVLDDRGIVLTSCKWSESTTIIYNLYFTRSANNMVFYQWGDLQAAKHLALFWTNATE